MLKLNFTKLYKNIVFFVSGLISVEIFSVFIWFNSIFIYFYTFFSFKFVESEWSLAFLDLSTGRVNRGFIFERIQAFREFSLYWVLQFEVILCLLFLLWIFYLCYFMFTIKTSKQQYLINLIKLMFSSVLTLDFYAFWNYINFFIRDLKFFYLNNLLQLDLWVTFSRLWILFFFKIVLCLLFNRLKSTSNSYDHPFFLFLVFSGMIVSLFVSNVIDIFLNFVILEILSFIIIGFSAFGLSKISLEASIKYFIYNTVVSGVSLFGFFCIFFCCKNTNFELLSIIFTKTTGISSNFFVVGLSFSVALWLVIFLFKLNIFPVCFYVLDLYESLSYAMIIYLSAIIKPAVFFVFCKIYFAFLCNLSLVNILLLVLGILSILVSSVLALFSIKIKKFLGLTSIWLYGFLIVCLSTGSVEILVLCIIYLFIYNLALSLFFSVLSTIFFNNKIKNNLLLFSELSFIFKEDTFYKCLMTLSILLISGLPPMFLFIYKYTIFLELFTIGYHLFVVIICLFNIINFYYYLNIIKSIWVYDKSEHGQKFDSIRHVYYIQVNVWFKAFIAVLTSLLLGLLLFTILKFDTIYIIVESVLQSIVYYSSF